MSPVRVATRLFLLFDRPLYQPARLMGAISTLQKTASPVSREERQTQQKQFAGRVRSFSATLKTMQITRPTADAPFDHGGNMNEFTR